VKGIPSKNVKGNESSQGPVPSGRRRTLVLGVILLIMLNAVGWLVWWKYFSPPPPPPEAAVLGTFDGALNATTASSSSSGLEDTATTNVSFTFSVALSPEAVKLGGIPGSRQKYQIDKLIAIEPTIKALIIENLKASSPDHAEPSQEALDQALKSYLALQLWNQNLDLYTTEKDKEGAALLVSYMGYVINTAEARPAPTPDAAPLMRLNVDYTALIVSDKARFTALENDSVDAFLKANPGYTLLARSYSFSPGGTDLIKVVALYTFAAPKK
jgi:hypothetical protein